MKQPLYSNIHAKDEWGSQARHYRRGPIDNLVTKAMMLVNWSSSQRATRRQIASLLNVLITNAIIWIPTLLVVAFVIGIMLGYRAGLKVR